jgi:hypothetical protein
MKKTIITILITLITYILSSCSHKFAKLEPYDGSPTIEQILKLKIYSNEDIEHLTIYAQLDRQKQRALLNGVGKLDKHVFSLEIDGDRYILKDLINKKEEKGLLSEFKLIPLDTDLIFKKIDIKNKQPIIFEDDDTRIELRVIEQKNISTGVQD